MMGDEATWSQQVFGACRCDLGNTPAHGAWSMWGRGRHQSTFRLQPRQLHNPKIDPTFGSSGTESDPIFDPIFR
jgi:hypothetical protein